jgi:pimeloyl-ACP methyl ester carboxylesterase
MSGAGHMLMLEDPEGFNQILGDVVAGFAEGQAWLPVRAV